MSPGPHPAAFTSLSSSHVHSSLSSSTFSTHTPTHVSLAATASTFIASSVASTVSSCSSACSEISGTPSVVNVVIHTTVAIPDFARFYKNVPAAAFDPHYLALADGSLVSDVFLPNLRVSEGWLVMGGALCVFFLRNTYRSIQYARVVNVKNKTLFYLLIVSQIIGIFVSTFFVIADFSDDVDCTATGMLKKGGVLVSSTMLVTGILGTKAYRCLSNAGFVIVILVFMRAVIIAVSGVVLVEYKGGRRFTGTCETVSESSLLPISIILQFLEACFICLCFMWAVYRSYRSPADHARLSLTAQEEDETSSVGTNEKDDDLEYAADRRGWWDYVPNGTNTRPGQPAGRRSNTSGRSSPKDMASRFRRWWYGEPMYPTGVFQRKSSLPGELPIPQPPRMSSASAAPSRISVDRESQHPRANSPPPPSVMERIIRYVPRAELLRTMLKNELLYTTFITAVLLVISIVMLVGVTQQLLLGANSWIILDWVIISMCTMHSFSRVARRHERESWLQDPTNWRSMHHAEVEDITSLRPKNTRRAWSPVSVASNWRQRHRQRGDSDIHSTLSRFRSTDMDVQFTDMFPPPRPSRSRVRSSSFSRSLDCLPAVSRSTSIASSPGPALDAVFKLPAPRAGHGSPMILPSPEFLPTGASTPQSDSYTPVSRGPIAQSPRALRSASGPAVDSRRRSSSAVGPRPQSPLARGAPAARMRFPDMDEPEPPDREPEQT